MNTIRKWTTPTETLTVEGVDLTEADIYVSLVQEDTTYLLENADITVSYEDDITTIEVTLTQAQTGALTAGRYVEVQINWLLDGERDATSIGKFLITRNLLDEVIS